MTPNEYQKLAMRTNTSLSLLVDLPGEYDHILHAVLGIGTEAGEIQDNLKRFLMYGKPFDKVNLVEECGDLLWYISLALNAVGATMEGCMKANIAKLKARYPAGFTEVDAIERDVDAERRAMTEEG